MAAPVGVPVLASGNLASVNQFHSANGTALRIGDVVTTGAGGNAVVTLGSSRANFGASSAATLESSALRMNHGYLRVSGNLALEIGRVTLTPSANADYEMLTLANGTSYVRVNSGSVAVSGVSNPVTVTAGTAAEVNNATSQVAAATCTPGLTMQWFAAILAAAIAISIIITYEATKTSSPSQL